jgi:hypothetical protein
MDTQVLSAEQAFERLEALDLDELNVCAALQISELESSIRGQLRRVSDRITAEREQLMRVLVECNGNSIAHS